MFRTFACILIVAASFAAAAGQAPGAKKEDAAKAQPTTSRVPIEPQRSVAMPGGVNLQFLLKELATDLDLNILFDAESRLERRTVSLDLKDVTTAEALKYILLQEGLVSEEVGPRTILIANRARASSLPQIGIGLTQMTAQLNQYFGSNGGALINHVQPGSPAAKAGLKAGDVIAEIDGMSIRNPLGLIDAVQKKNGGDFTLKIVRDRKIQTVTVSLPEEIR